MSVLCFKKSTIIPGTTIQCSGDHTEDFHDSLEYLVLNLTQRVELYKNQAREAVEMYQEERAKVLAVRLAWYRPGSHPDFHERAQKNLMRTWPTLAQALQKLGSN